MSRQLAKTALDALDSIWSNDCPAFTPNSYAILTAAELQLVAAATDLYYPTPDVQPRNLASRSSNLSPVRSRNEGHKGTALGLQPSDMEPELEPTSCLLDVEPEPEPESRSYAFPWSPSELALYDNKPIGTACFVGPQDLPHDDEPYVINVPGDVPNNNVVLFELRARYSRALCRAAFQLFFHGEGSALIGYGPLSQLLNSISLASGIKNLASESQTSLLSHHPQAGDHTTVEFFIQVVGTRCERISKPLNIGDADGLVVGILRVLASANIELAPEVELAANNALSAVFPLLMTQWLRMSPDLPTGQDFDLVKDLLQQIQANSSDGLVNHTVRLLLMSATVAVACTGCPGIMDLPEQSMAALCSRAKLTSGRIPTHRVLRSQRDILPSLVRLINRKQAELKPATLKSIIGFLSTTYTSSMFNWFIGRTELPDVLCILAATPGCKSEVEIILGDLGEYLTPEHEFLALFMESDQGFSQLVAIAEHAQHVAAVLKCVTVIATIVADNKSGYPEDKRMSSLAIPGFLDAIALVSKHISSRENNLPDLEAFMRASLSLLCSLQSDEMTVVANHASTKTICKILHSSATIPPAGSELLIELVDVQDFAKTEDIPLRWLPLLFEHQE